ncbi:MAG: esterase family protein, partial [Bacteroidota bacterium]
MSSFRTIELSDAPFEWEGLRFMTVKSPSLKGRGDICLYVPHLTKEAQNLPIYILLHGVYGSAWIWALKGGALQTAQKLMDAG